MTVAYPGRALYHAGGAIFEGFVVACFIGWAIFHLVVAIPLAAIFILWPFVSAAFWWLNMDSEIRGWIIWSEPD